MPRVAVALEASGMLDVQLGQRADRTRRSTQRVVFQILIDPTKPKENNENIRL